MGPIPEKQISLQDFFYSLKTVISRKEFFRVDLYEGLQYVVNRLKVVKSKILTYVLSTSLLSASAQIGPRSAGAAYDDVVFGPTTK